MSKKANRAAFAPAQATSAVQSLDFDAAAETFARALALDGTGKTEDETAQIAARIAEAADRLMSAHPTNTAQIAVKMEAYGWLSTISPRLSDPGVQGRILKGSDDWAKGLLCLYFDLAAVSRSAPVPFGAGTFGGGEAETRAAWESALSTYEAAKAKADAIAAAEDGNGEDMSEEWNAASDAAGEALEALLLTRAPDGVAMGVKARLVIERAHIFYRGDDVSDPDFIAGMLADGWDETALAALYQDGLALAGVGGPVVEATPDTFDGEEWLEAVEAETGSRMVRSDSHSPAVHFEGGDVDAANARLAALRPAHGSEVEREAYNRAQRDEWAAAGRAPERIPTSPEEMQSVFARGLLNCTPEADQERLTAALAALGISPVVWKDEKGEPA